MKTIYLSHLITSSIVMHFPSGLHHTGIITYWHLEEMQSSFDSLNLSI